jgi:NAD(P)-dependent dehydrogenase (short-subunit alcohol dehydrogenase family)
MILKNKSILVTGAGKGIGLSVTNKASIEGAIVYAITRSKKDIVKLNRIKNVKAFYGDASNFKLIKKIMEISIKEKNIITGLVNNAGERQRIDFLKIDKKKIQHIFNANFFTTFFNMQIFSKVLKNKNLSGSIVNIGSIVGQLGFNQLVGYASSKSALVGLTKSVSAEMSKYKIRSNIINPGFIKTSFYKNFKKDKKSLYKWTTMRTSMKRWGEPEEIADLVCFLLSNKSSYITGESINIDGGWTSS